MLNYIWAGLIAFSLVFALSTDISDLSRNTYRNGQPLAATLKLKSADATARLVGGDVVIDPATYASHFDTKSKPGTSYAGTLVRGERGATLHFSRDAAVPEPLA